MLSEAAHNVYIILKKLGKSDKKTCLYCTNYGRIISIEMDNIYKLDGRVPVGKAIPFGLQHIFAIFPKNMDAHEAPKTEDAE